MPKRIILALVAAIPVFAYFVYLFRFSIPFPNEDDLPVIFGFINHAFPFDEQSLKLFFTPFREHVILPAKIIAYLQVIISGCVNLKTMVVVGNLCWVRVAWLLYGSSKEAKMPSLYFLPVLFILFQLQFTETALWPMAVWSNMVVIWLAFESIHVLVNNEQKLSRWHFALAFLCAAGATFSNGNGLLSIFIGLGVLIVQRASLAQMAIWSLLGIVFLGGYWWAKSLGVPDATYGIQTNPVQWLLGICLFIGGYGDFISGSFKWVAAGLGAGIMLVLLLTNFKTIQQARYWSSSTFKLTAYALFALLTAAAVALLRTEPVGADAALLGRYRHYSALLVGIGYLILLIQLQNNKVILHRLFLVFLGVSMGVWGLSYYRDWGYRYMEYQKFWADTYNMQHNNLLYLNWKDQNGLPEIYQTSQSQNIVCQTDSPLMDVSALKTDSLLPFIPTTLEWETVSEDTARCRRVATVKTDTLRFQLNQGEAWLWMLKSNRRFYFISATATKTNPIQFLTKQQYFRQGFAGEIPACFLERGTYQLFLVNARRRQAPQVFRTNRFVESGQ
ncbi:hypothetical protein DR864_18045 [Runella rosea]|uniref:4-amino-4-deoxy-L-arabinose transferase n=1 Tax=Runella rosea TaxID=2259595 RepID=A0A344TLI2_9BACT|nr:hypothetical protein [Runella rosea]AXE19503.1 hypothetical protein DR864_18045 [Runella rosea]